MYGKCDACDVDLEPVFFIEDERDLRGYLTGRVRRAVDYLYCPYCGRKDVCDSSFDGEWHFSSFGQERTGHESK